MSNSKSDVASASWMSSASIQMKDISHSVAGEVDLKVFPDPSRKTKRKQWSQVERVAILVMGDLHWKSNPGRQYTTFSCWRGGARSKHTRGRFDLVRGRTYLAQRNNNTPTVLELEAEGGRQLIVKTGSKEEADFWEERIRLHIVEWKELIAIKPSFSPSTRQIPRPASVYDVSPNTDIKSGESLTGAAKTVWEKSQAVWDAAKEGMEFAAEKAGEAANSGLLEVLKAAPLVGVAFTVVGYGLEVAERYVQDNKDLPEAQVEALELSKQCIRHLISLEYLRNCAVCLGKSELWTPTDEERHDRIIQALDQLEISFRILNEMQLDKGRLKMLNMFFKDHGEATGMLRVTLETCKSRLYGLETHHALMGVDLVRAMVAKVHADLDSETVVTSQLTESVNQIQVDLAAVVAAVVGGGAHSSALLEKNLLQRIRACQRIKDFIDLYDSDQFQQSLKRLEIAQNEKDQDVWSKGWALKICTGDPEAEALNKERKACLELLYVMCNRWKKDEVKTVSDDDILNEFGAKRIKRILNSCLPMDRAQALYHMKLTKTKKRGMHWFAQEHVDKYPEWQEIMKEYNGFPTINKRLLWLMDFEKLGLRHYHGLDEWLQPEINKYEG